MLECKYLVIGSGQTALALAKELSKTNKKVILVERDKLGANYLNSHEVVKDLLTKISSDFSISAHEFEGDKTVLKKLFNNRDEVFNKFKSNLKKIKSNLKADLAFKNLQIIDGEAGFKSESMVEVNSKKERHLITFEKCLLAVGKDNLVQPTIEGIDNIPFLYQDNFINDFEISKTFAIIGLTKDSLEIADIVSNLGIKVDIYEAKSKSKVFAEMDGDVLTYLIKSASKKNIDINFRTSINALAHSRKKIELFSGKKTKNTADQVYIPLKKKFLNKSLNLEKISVKNDFSGIKINKANQTSSQKVFAFGECVKDIKIQEKLPKVRDFVESELNRGLQKKDNLISNLINKNKSLNFDSSLLVLDGSYPVFKYKLWQHQAEQKFGLSAKTIIITDEYHEGFLKLTYHKSSQIILGFSTCGFFSKFGFLIAGEMENSADAKKVLLLIDSLRSII